MLLSKQLQDFIKESALFRVTQKEEENDKWAGGQ